MGELEQNSNQPRKRKSYDDEEGSYIKALTYLVLAIVGLSILMWGLSKFVDNKPSTTATASSSGEKKENTVRPNPYQYDKQGQHYEDRNKDNPLKSKDSSEAILAKVANKILAITEDPDTECSMPIFDNPKQYWVTECDFKQATVNPQTHDKVYEKAHQKFSILLDKVEKIQ